MKCLRWETRERGNFWHANEVIYYLSNRSRRKFSINYEFLAIFFIYFVTFFTTCHVNSLTMRWEWKIAHFSSLFWRWYSFVNIFTFFTFSPENNKVWEFEKSSKKKKGSRMMKIKRNFNEQRKPTEIKPQKPSRPWTILFLFSVIAIGPLFFC